MRLLTAMLLFGLTGSAIADEAKAPDPKPARLGLRVVKVMPESHQALLFDKNRGTHVLVEVGKTIDGFTVQDIDDEEVVLGAFGASVVLSAPGTDQTWRRVREGHEALGIVTAKPDPYGPPVTPAVASPVDPYADVRTAEAPKAIDAGEGGVRVVTPTGAAPQPIVTSGLRIDPAVATAIPTPAAASGSTTEAIAAAATTATAVPTTAPASAVPTTAPATAVPASALATAVPASALATAVPASATTAVPTTATAVTAVPAMAPASDATPATAVAPASDAVVGPADPYGPPATAAPTVVVATTVASAPATAPAAAADATPAPTTAPIPAPVVAAELATTLGRAEVDRALLDFGKLSTSAKGVFTPAGLRLDKLVESSLYFKAGLRAGDVVTAVDGRPLHSIDDAADLYARSTGVKAAIVSVIRDGKPMTLRVAIQ